MQLQFEYVQLSWPTTTTSFLFFYFTSHLGLSLLKFTESQSAAADDDAPSARCFRLFIEFIITYGQKAQTAHIYKMHLLPQRVFICSCSLEFLSLFQAYLCVSVEWTAQRENKLEWTNKIASLSSFILIENKRMIKNKSKIQTRIDW